MAQPAREKALKIRPVRAELLGLDRARVAVITIVAGEDLPEVVMFNGDPFIHDPQILGTAYRQVRPFRAIGQ